MDLGLEDSGKVSRDIPKAAATVYTAGTIGVLVVEIEGVWKN